MPESQAKGTPAPMSGATPSSSGPATIEDKIRAIVRQDDTGGFVTAAERRPKVENLTEWETDLIDWGALYGLAYGIARAENPWETFESVAERAYEAAWPVYVEWATDFKYDKRDRSYVTERVVREYHKVANDRSRLPHEFVDLEDALIDLSNNTPL